MAGDDLERISRKGGRARRGAARGRRAAGRAPFALLLPLALTGCFLAPSPRTLDFATSPLILRGDYEGRTAYSTFASIPGGTAVTLVAEATYVDEETYDVAGTVTFHADPPQAYPLEGRVRAYGERYLRSAHAPAHLASLEGVLVTPEARWDLRMDRFLDESWGIDVSTGSDSLGAHVAPSGAEERGRGTGSGPPSDAPP